MKIQVNKTSPLPYESYCDNKLYLFNREDVTDDVCLTPLKRAKLTKFVSPSVPLKRKSVISALRRRSISNSSFSSLILPQVLPETKFSFTACKSDTSDLESLPDLTEDDSSPFLSPLASPKKFQFFDDVPTNNRCSFSQPSIFEIPEIVHKILEYVDMDCTYIPREQTPIRRKPLSYEHAFLIHGDKNLAQSAVKEQSSFNTKPQSYSNSMLNCLLVNRLFHQIASEVISKRFHFSDEQKFINYLSSKSTIKFKPEVFVLHKLFRTKQHSIAKLQQQIDFSNLKWLELYMCPRLTPTIDFLSPKLTRLIITGSRVFDDDCLKMVSTHCRNLQVLDIRACELVTDAGIYQVGENCRKLTMINFGRKQKGHLVTDSSVSHLVRNNHKLTTVGLAGCHISDNTVWELAIHCSQSLERLSLNNCPGILNQSIPLILSRRNQNQSFYFENLSVLELRFNLQLTNWLPIIEFKRRQEYRGIPMLIEICETLMMRMRQQELHMDKQISQRIFTDILSWANDEDDGDELFRDLIESRRKTMVN